MLPLIKGTSTATPTDTIAPAATAKSCLLTSQKKISLAASLPHRQRPRAGSRSSKNDSQWVNRYLIRNYNIDLAVSGKSWSR